MGIASNRITIHELARLCSVSPTTVSHAFTGKRPVDAETRARIMAAASQAGYRPSRVAQALRSRRTGVIGLVLPFIEGESRHSRDFLSFEYFMRVAASAAATALRHGYALMLLPGAEQEGTLRALGIDGVIICDPDDDDRRVALCKRIGLPLVTLGRDLTGGDGVPCVVSDGGGNIRRLLEHMRKAGARRIGLLGAVSRSSWRCESERAYLGWCARRRQEPVLVHASLRRSARADLRLADRLLDPALGLDGVLALEEIHGVTLLQAALSRGIDVPDSLMVALALDGAQAKLSVPSLTAIDLGPDRQGSAVVELLMRAMEEGLGVPSRTLAARIVARGSTAGRTTVCRATLAASGRSNGPKIPN